jgi:hypothetical protein
VRGGAGGRGDVGRRGAGGAGAHGGVGRVGGPRGGRARAARNPPVMSNPPAARRPRGTPPARLLHARDAPRLRRRPRSRRRLARQLEARAAAPAAAERLRAGAAKCGSRACGPAPTPPPPLAGPMMVAGGGGTRGATAAAAAAAGPPPRNTGPPALRPAAPCPPTHLRSVPAPRARSPPLGWGGPGRAGLPARTLLIPPPPPDESSRIGPRRARSALRIRQAVPSPTRPAGPDAQGNRRRPLRPRWGGDGGERGGEDDGISPRG